MADNKKTMEALAKIRMLKHPESEGAFVFAQRDRVGLVGGPDTSVISDKDGVYINGKVSFGALPQEVKLGPAWSFNPVLVSTMPSTMSTPIPVLQFNFPGTKFMQDMQAIISTASSFLV